MSRYLLSLRASAILIAVVILTPVFVAGQAPSATKATAAATTSTLRTPWGDPDLQGIWTGSTLTPLERPKELAGKQFLTEQEVAALEKQAAERAITDRTPEPGDTGTYNQIWFDPGTKAVPDRRTSLIVDPPDGRIPYTPEARKRQDAQAHLRTYGPFNSWLDVDTGERCLTDGLPMFWLGYNPNHQIVQAPGYVMIVHEMFRDRRIIPLSGRPHGVVPQWNGDIRGRWEGDTLVVETTNFVDKADQMRWANTWRAPSKTMRLIERFTRVDAETIEYRFTLEDPSKFTRPWTAVLPLTTNQAARGVTSGRLYEYACHEGNYALVHVLRGARADEKAAADAAKKTSR